VWRVTFDVWRVTYDTAHGHYVRRVCERFEVSVQFAAVMMIMILWWFDDAAAAAANAARFNLPLRDALASSSRTCLFVTHLQHAFKVNAQAAAAAAAAGVGATMT